MWWHYCGYISVSCTSSGGRSLENFSILEVVIITMEGKERYIKPFSLRGNKYTTLRGSDVEKSVVVYRWWPPVQQWYSDMLIFPIENVISGSERGILRWNLSYIMTQPGIKPRPSIVKPQCCEYLCLYQVSLNNDVSYVMSPYHPFLLCWTSFHFKRILVIPVRIGKLEYSYQDHSFLCIKLNEFYWCYGNLQLSKGKQEYLKYCRWLFHSNSQKLPQNGQAVFDLSYFLSVESGELYFNFSNKKLHDMVLKVTMISQYF